MANANVNKVVYGGRTLIDLTSDTVIASKLATGYVAHDKAGNVITGSMEQTITNVTVNNGSVSKISGTADDYLLTLS